ncbi:MAG TPA: DUF1329 domain-containing protein [Candidatus Binataceae bacterium]|nr:DUF1329 domain-containing protein [Candidatus Binataceae bacterium]
MSPRALARILFAVLFSVLEIRVEARAQAPSTPLATPMPAHPIATASPIGLVPGTIISATNASQFASLLPQAARFALGHGFKIEVAPSRRLQWSAGYQSATEKFSPQVHLDAQDHIANYIAGMPFPLIDLTDPKAAIKIAYNWHLGPVMPDDFSLAPWVSNGYSADPANPARIVPIRDADYQCDHFTFLRFAHRTEVDPRPTFGSNPMGVEWKARCNDWSATPRGSGNGEGAGIWVRYLDPATPDAFYSFDEATRRVRTMAVAASDPGPECRNCHQPYWAYALPKTEDYQYRLLGTATILACLSAREEPAGISAATEGYRLTREPFELRHAYILEMRSGHGDQTFTTIIYIDSEVYVWLAAQFYKSGVETASAIPLWRMRPAAEGGNLFDLAGSFYVPAGGGSFFRSLVPAHQAFQQQINTGNISEAAFLPTMLSR